MSLENECIALYVNTDLETLSYSVAQLPSDMILEFIKLVDERVADWDFTRQLWEHFENEHKAYDEETTKEEARIKGRITND